MQRIKRIKPNAKNDQKYFEEELQDDQELEEKTNTEESTLEYFTE